MKTKGIVKSLFDFETKEHQILLRKLKYIYINGRCTDENQDLTINHDYISCTLWDCDRYCEHLYQKFAYSTQTTLKLRLKIKA